MSVATEVEITMSVVNMAKDIKKVHPEDVVMYKVGNFVQSFGKEEGKGCYVEEAFVEVGEILSK